MSAWMPSPSPSLDALSSQSSSSSSSSAFLVGWHVASSLPRRLWDAYVAYLWYYQPNSWVSRLASTFRILAVILVLPVVLLTLLDVSSYVIARTLGVVDDIKASISDADTGHSSDAPNKIGVAARASAAAATCACPTTSSTSISSSSSSTSSSLLHGVGVGGSVYVSEGLVSEEDSGERRTDRDVDGYDCASETVMVSSTTNMHARAQTTPIQSQGQSLTRVDASSELYYFTGEEDLRLAGEGVFSPAVSMPPSPLAPRMPLHTFMESDGRDVGQGSEDTVLRRRVQSAREDELSHT